VDVKHAHDDAGHSTSFSSSGSLQSTTSSFLLFQRTITFGQWASTVHNQSSDEDITQCENSDRRFDGLTAQEWSGLLHLNMPSYGSRCGETPAGWICTLYFFSFYFLCRGILSI
jgi:hypothetical protein